MNTTGTPIKSITEYLDTVKSLYSTSNLLWFRGQSIDHELLIPKLMRHADGLKLEEGLYFRFQANAIPLLDKQPNSYFEWLFVMQHYGIPTRLLDWTKDSLIALSFAVMNRKPEQSDKDAIVYCLNPCKLNEDFIKSYQKPDNFIPNIIMKDINDLFGLGVSGHYRWPIACIGPLNNARIIAQKGAFTIFPPRGDTVSLKHMSNVDNFLTGIIIDKDSIDTIKNDLFLFGIKENTIYPSLENLALEIITEFNL